MKRKSEEFELINQSVYLYQKKGRRHKNRKQMVLFYATSDGYVIDARYKEVKLLSATTNGIKK